MADRRPFDHPGHEDGEIDVPSSSFWSSSSCSSSRVGPSPLEPKSSTPKRSPKEQASRRRHRNHWPLVCSASGVAFLIIILNLLGGPTDGGTANSTTGLARQMNRRSAGSIFDSILGSASPADQPPPSLAGHENQAAHSSPSNGNDPSQLIYRIGQTSDKVTLQGDILLGGLFPIHMKGTKVECGQINRDRGIQRLEAMLYALDRINEDSSLLPDIKLGAILLDSCSSSTYALNQSLEFIRASINTVESSAFECKDKSTPRPKYGSKMIAGVIGGSYSEVSLQVANLLRLFRIPQVSYASTGTALSDKTLYDLFARTVPSDMFQARAIADIVLKMNWSYVSLVSSDGLYGDSGSREFIKQASNRRICIATHEKISPTIGEQAYDGIVANLLKRNATGVVLFTRAEDTRELLLAVKRAKLVRNFAWVAADGWGTHQKLVEGVEDAAWGAITVELQAKAIPGFDEYMKALTPWANLRNPWFSEYWQGWFDCQLQANLLQQQRLASGASSSGLAGSFNQRRTATRPNLDYDQTRLDADDDNDDDDNKSPGRNRRAAATQTTGGCSASPATSASRSQASQAVNKTNQCTSLVTTQVPPASGRPNVTGQPARTKRSLANYATTDDVKQFCSPNLRISETNGYRQEQKVQFVVDAVYAMAHALHKAWSHLCDARPGDVCEALKELNGGEFYNKYLLNVSFKDLAGSEVKFDERGDGLGRYNIYNFRQVRPQSAPPNKDLVAAAAAAATTNDSIAELDLLGGGSPDAAPIDKLSGVAVASFQQEKATQSGQPMVVEHIYTTNVEFEYSSIGRWTEDDYYLSLDEIQFFQGEHQVPESYCSKPCELGQAKIMRAGDHCCWICKTCQPYEFLPDEFNCEDCGIGRWPVPNKTSCFNLPQKHLRWDHIYSLISLSIACLGIIITLFVTIIFIRYIDTPVVKASGRELSFILLAGIACCHMSTFVLLSKPTTFICGAQRFLVNFGFALMYASLLVKTNRISRIFNCARKSAKRPSFISPKSQMLITGILVAIQIFLTIVWFVFEAPGTRADSPEGKRDEVILKCKAKGKSFILSLVYNMILITTCTVYAVKTRKIPENFNESKFIGFTMYTTIVIWLAFVTIVFGTHNSYENVRKLTMNSATYKRAFKPMSSVASVEGRNNLASGGAQPDAASGGPLSNTSNVLNIGDAQNNARLQESSIVSNVVNSNSAGSNCSQKTPPTLSQQLNLVGICTNCGSRQLTAAPAMIATSTTNMVVSKTANDRYVTSGCGRESSSRTQNLDARSKQQFSSCQSMSNRTITTASSSVRGPRNSDQSSSILMATNMNNNNNLETNKQATRQQGSSSSSTAAAAAAKVLHTKIARTSTSPQARPSGSSRAINRVPSDEQLHLVDVHYHHHRHHDNQCDHAKRHQQQKHKLLSSADQNNDNQQLNRAQKKQIASLSRLNEMTSLTSSGDKHCFDDSISSLANDSFINTSQDNTTCNNGALGSNGNGGLTHGHCKGSDSMLCNQSVQSMDYCSDCCPSLCHCSCPVCSSSNGCDENGMGLCGHAVSAGGGLQSLGTLRLLGEHANGCDYDALCINQHHHEHQQQYLDERAVCGLGADTTEASSMTTIRRLRSDEDEQRQVEATTSFAAYQGSFFKGHARSSSGGIAIDQMVGHDELLASASGSGSDVGDQTGGGHRSGARRSQTMEMCTLTGGQDQQMRPKRQSVQDTPSGAIDSSNEMTPTTTSRLPGRRRSSSSSSSSSSTSTSKAQQAPQISSATTPIVYALQAAATSALGAATCQVSLVASSVSSSGPDGGRNNDNNNNKGSLNSSAASNWQQQQQQQPAPHQNFQFTSSRDKTGSEIGTGGGTSGEPPGKQGPRQASSSSSSRKTSSSLQAKQRQQQQQPVGTTNVVIGGTIQASLDRVKSSDARRKCKEANEAAAAAAASRQVRKSGCFNYHDEYEYSYGLVQSNSDSERDAYYYEDGDDDEADIDSSMADAFLAAAAATAGPAAIMMRPTASAELPPATNAKRRQTNQSKAAHVHADLDYDDDGDNEEDDDYDHADDDDHDLEDNFEHDGRVSLDRQSGAASKLAEDETSRRRSSSSRHGSAGRSSTGGSRKTSSAADKRAKEQLHVDPDEHRINSLTLITATLSAGGAIVESGSSASVQTSGVGAETEAGGQAEGSSRSKKKFNGQRQPQHSPEVP